MIHILATALCVASGIAVESFFIGFLFIVFWCVYALGEQDREKSCQKKNDTYAREPYRGSPILMLLVSPILIDAGALGYLMPYGPQDDAPMDEYRIILWIFILLPIIPQIIYAIMRRRLRTNNQLASC